MRPSSYSSRPPIQLEVLVWLARPLLRHGKRTTKLYGRWRWRNAFENTLLCIIILCWVLLLADIHNNGWEQPESKYAYLKGYDVKEGYSYPLEMKDFPGFIERLRLSTGNLTQDQTQVNTRYSTVQYLRSPVVTADEEEVGLLILVKSAVRNEEKRQSIRATWGSASYLSATKVVGNLQNRLIFICGTETPGIQPAVSDLVSNDMLVADFIDTYDNNTYKTMHALRWVVEEGPRFHYLLLADDDVYMDLENLATYLEGFPTKRFSLSWNEKMGPVFPYYKFTTKTHDVVTGKDILNSGLYMGKLYEGCQPYRPGNPDTNEFKKWEVSFFQYRYNIYPPYLPGAAIVFSSLAVEKFHTAGPYIAHFPIDDVFLGIIAQKLGIVPLGNHHFHIHGPLTRNEDEFSEVITLHGFECPEQMKDLWLNRDVKTFKLCDSQ